ncbi:MAG TPA: YebC/PmpR family DNA-binding transcriptional regulator [Bacillota bacterium]|nr:YebC/PmpR family DNA-binding transcriptional regulator [Bacillota bacterium]
MSGHSKWATIKRKKEKTDAQRGQAFTKVTRDIIMATKAGGPDPEGNFRLRLAIQNAKAINMPNDNIQRAIKRGAGESEGEAIDEVMYEGYGPGGCALLVQVLTGNRNRTASEMRYIFSRNGGNLGEAGCVAWMFDQKGIIEIPMDKVTMTEDELLTLAMEAGAEDAKIGEEAYEITMDPADLDTVRKYLEAQNKPYSRAELTMVPKNTVEITGEAVPEVIKLVDLLEEHEDVQNVYGNFEISDEEMEKYME